MTPKTKNFVKFFASFAATIAALGALAFYLVIPYMQNDIGPDPQAEAHLFRIAKAYVLCAHTANPPDRLPAQPGDTAHDAALLFAKKVQLYETRVWVVEKDPLLTGRKIPNFVVQQNLNDLEMDPLFARLPLGVELAANVSLTSPAKTPIAWTRGLRPDGTWSPDSPFSGLGGYIAFLDGHIEWHMQLGGKKGTPLVKFGTTEPTVDLRAALPPGAVILSAFPKRIADDFPVPAATTK